MKRFFGLLLLLALVFSLTACGSSQKTGGAPVEENGTASEQEQSVSDPETNTLGDPVVEETVLLENDSCKITLTGIEPDNMWGYTLRIQLENKTADKTLVFSVDKASVNGLDSDPFFASEVSAGKKANEEVSFYDSTLDDAGITDYTDIFLLWRVYDSVDWSADDVLNEGVHVYPFGEEKAVKFVREPQPGDIVIAENGSVRATVIEIVPDSFYGYTVMLYLENNTDTTVMFSADSVSVNGFMVDPYYADSVGAGMTAYSEMSWFESDFEDNGITEVEEIEFTLRVYDAESWSSSGILNTTVVLNP